MTSRGLRVRDLFRAFMVELAQGDVIAEAAALRCAELTTTAEDIRARIKAGEVALAGELVRIENLCDRAVRGLAKIKPAEAGMDWGDIQDEADRIEQAEREAAAERQRSA